MPSDRARVEDVGGPQDAGPWPSDVSEIAKDDRLTRPVKMGDGTVQETEVLITGVSQIIRPDGTETDGYTVSFQHRGGV